MSATPDYDEEMAVYHKVMMEGGTKDAEKPLVDQQTNDGEHSLP